MVSAGSRVLLGLEGEFPLHLFILEDALLIAKKRVQQHEGSGRFFQRRFPDGSVSSAATAVELWMQASFDVAKGKVNMDEEQPGPSIEAPVREGGPNQAIQIGLQSAFQAQAMASVEHSAQESVEQQGTAFLQGLEAAGQGPGAAQGVASPTVREQPQGLLSSAPRVPMVAPVLSPGGTRPAAAAVDRDGVAGAAVEGNAFLQQGVQTSLMTPQQAMRVSRTKPASAGTFYKPSMPGLSRSQALSEQGSDMPHVGQGGRGATLAQVLADVSMAECWCGMPGIMLDAAMQAQYGFMCDVVPVDVRGFPSPGNQTRPETILFDFRGADPQGTLTGYEVKVTPQVAAQSNIAYVESNAHGQLQPMQVLAQKFGAVTEAKEYPNLSPMFNLKKHH